LSTRHIEVFASVLLTSVRKKWKLRTLATYVFLLGVVILTRKSGSSHAAHLRKHSAKRKSNENFGGRFRGGGGYSPH